MNGQTWVALEDGRKVVLLTALRTMRKWRYNHEWWDGSRIVYAKGSAGWETMSVHEAVAKGDGVEFYATHAEDGQGTARHRGNRHRGGRGGDGVGAGVAQGADVAVAGKWVRFPVVGPSASGRTTLWAVETTMETVEEGVVLGYVKWCGPWRCYAFYPEVGTLYERRCLRDIADFCEAESKAQLSRARSRRAG